MSNYTEFKAQLDAAMSALAASPNRVFDLTLKGGIVMEEGETHYFIDQLNTNPVFATPFTGPLVLGKARLKDAIVLIEALSAHHAAMDLDVETENDDRLREILASAAHAGGLSEMTLHKQGSDAAVTKPKAWVANPPKPPVPKSAAEIKAQTARIKKNYNEEMGDTSESFFRAVDEAVTACEHDANAPFTLSYIHIDAGKAEHIANILRTNPALKGLKGFRLEHCDAGAEALGIILRALPPSITSLSIEGAKWGAPASVALRDKLPLWPKFESLTIAGSELSAASFKGFANQLPARISHLDLERNPLHNSGASAMVPILGKMLCLQHLSIAECQMDDDGIAGIAPALPLTLEHTDISGNPMEYPAGVAVAKRLSEFKEAPLLLYDFKKGNTGRRPLEIETAQLGIDTALNMLRDRTAASKSERQWKEFMSANDIAPPDEGKSTWDILKKQREGEKTAKKYKS